MFGVNDRAITTMALLGVFVATTGCPSFAGNFWNNHPRRGEVLRRDNHINGTLNKDYGDLSGHYGQLERQDLSIRRQEQRWAGQNGGYITKSEQSRLNSEENGLNREIGMDQGRPPGDSWFEQHHPRRDQVLDQSGSMFHTLNQDRGDLGGNYGSLLSQDTSIRRQEQQDARQNGGFITASQQQQLDSQEAALQQQINQDYHP